MIRTFSIAAIVAAFGAGTAMAGCGAVVAVTFTESAPRDIVSVENRSSEPLDIVEISFDLAASTGLLVFDTAPGGAGVEVYQSYQPVPGPVRPLSTPDVMDGGEVLSLDFDSFATGDAYAFTIDVDDRLPVSALGQIRVSGAEISGARVVAKLRDQSGAITKLDGMFSDQAIAELRPACG